MFITFLLILFNINFIFTSFVFFYWEIVSLLSFENSLYILNKSPLLDILFPQYFLSVACLFSYLMSSFEIRKCFFNFIEVQLIHFFLVCIRSYWHNKDSFPKWSSQGLLLMSPSKHFIVLTPTFRPKIHFWLNFIHIGKT